MRNIILWAPHELADIIFPRSCLKCGVVLNLKELHLCLHCWSDLPLSSFYPKVNPVYRLFEERIDLTMGFSLLEFEKSSLTQKLIHELKYQKNPGLGLLLGRIIGQKFKVLLNAEGVDLIVPVPLHWKRKVNRTYNQSETIARGIARQSGIDFSGKFLKRIKQTPSQTTLTRYQRWMNMEKVFKVSFRAKSPMHVLLVDDVITTGATLESCINAIDKKVDCAFSVLSLARST